MVRFSSPILRLCLNSRLSNCMIRNFVTLRLLTKDGCQLCDESKKIINKEFPNVKIEEVYITDAGNEDLYDRWKWEIPVFYLDGKFLCKNRIDLELLKQKIKGKVDVDQNS